MYLNKCINPSKFTLPGFAENFSNLSFAVHKLEKFSANPGEVNFEGSINLLRYIRDNKTLGLKYYSDLNDARVTYLLRKPSIKTKNDLMDFSDYSWQYFPNTVRSTGAYIIFYQGEKIDHGTYVPGPVAQSSAESEYNAACTAGMALAHFRMLIRELLNKDPYIVTEEAPFIVLDSKSAMCMANNGKDTKHTRQIARIIHLVRNGNKFKMHKTDWCEGGMQSAEIFTKNVSEPDITARMNYIMVTLKTETEHL